MSPGGHLVTTALACAGAVALTHGAPAAETLTLVAGIAAGGFGIDVDHMVDYVLFERQRDLRPATFLRYYLSGRVRHAVLVLHSYELFALLALAAWWSGSLALTAYLAGAVLHLALDIVFNGELTPNSIVAFYSVAYRAAHRFDAERLFGRQRHRVSPRFWVAFFRGPDTPIGARDGGAVPAAAERARRPASAAEEA
jgi:hypothetical protein